MKIDFKKIQYKKILMNLFIALVSFYALWNLCINTFNHFWRQGYNSAVLQTIEQAENQECAPFSVFTQEKTINLINIDCLDQLSEE
jgi:predicted secreted protein